MAHEIEFRNGVAQMAYVGATPWHGLGKRLDVAPTTVAEACRMAGLAGWEVQLQQLYLADGRKVDQFATVRKLDGAIVGNGVGSNYRVVQNEVALAPFDAFLKAGAASVETAGSLKGGSKVWLLAKVNRPDAVVVPRSDDRVAQYLVVATSHDGSIAVSFQTTPIRVVCQNTLSAAMGDGRNAMRVRHTASAEATLDAVTGAIEKMDADFRKSADMWKALAKVQVTEAKVRAYIDAVFPPAPGKVTAPPAELMDLDDVIPGKAPASNGVADFASLLSRPARINATQDETTRLLGKPAGARDESRRVQDNVIEILERGGRGLDMPGVKGTAWAAYNAVTEYLTWERGRSNDNRMQALWFGDIGKRALSAAADSFLK